MHHQKLLELLWHFKDVVEVALPPVVASSSRGSRNCAFNFLLESDLHIREELQQHHPTCGLS